MDIKKTQIAFEAFVGSLSPEQVDGMIAVLQAMRNNNQPDEESYIEARIRNILQELGVPTNLQGYPYLVDAIKLAYEDSSLLRGMVTKKLYPQVAKLHNTTPSRAERSLRYAIEKGWDRCGIEMHEKYFGSTVSPEKGRPENALYIATILECLRYRVSN